MPLNRNVGLVLGGGGARGAFHAGALHRLLTNEVADGGKKYPRLDFRRIGVVTGTSTGSLCAAMVVQFLARNAGRSPGDALDTSDLDTLLHVYRDTGMDGVMKPRLDPGWASVINAIAGVLGAGNLPVDRIAGLVLGPSIWDQEPLRKLIRQHVDIGLQKTAADLGIELVVNAFDMTTQRGETFSNVADRAILHDAIIASAAIPAVMTPQKIKRGGATRLYVDGAIAAPMPYAPATRAGISRILAISLNYLGDRAGKSSYDLALEVLKDAAYALDQEVSDACELRAKYSEAIGRIRENCVSAGIELATVVKGVDATVLTQNPSGAVRRHFTLHIPKGTPVIEDIDFDKARMQALSVTGESSAVGKWQAIAAALELPAHA